MAQSEPLDRMALRGRVVLVNSGPSPASSLRQEPYVRARSQAYGDDGLVVLGVHTPEFSFEHDTDPGPAGDAGEGDRLPGRGRQPLRDLERLRQRLLAGLYFVDPEGVIRDEHFGEGRYEQSEHVLLRLLRIRREPVVVEPAGVEAQADWEHLLTPEIYLGYERGRGFASPAAGCDESRSYELPPTCG